MWCPRTATWVHRGQVDGVLVRCQLLCESVDGYALVSELIKRPQSCGATKGVIIDFYLLKRLCEPCRMAGYITETQYSASKAGKENIEVLEHVLYTQRSYSLVPPS